MNSDQSFESPEELKNEYNLIYERIDDEEKPVFKKFCSYYKTVEELKILFIRYRHYLKDIYDADNWGKLIYEPINRPIRIGFLVNRDKVFYNELDDVICNYLRNEGAEIVKIKYEDIQLTATKNGLELLINMKPLNFDAFLSYGYRNRVNMESYLMIVKLLEMKGVVCLHSHYHEIILNNKMLQSTHFGSINVPIPDTFQVFDVASAKELAYSKLDGTTIVKYLNDYGGDGVFKVEDKWNVVNAVAKNLWKGEQVLLQKMIPDSLGQSIRVLCIEGKAFACMKYEDGSGDFRSNCNYGHSKFRCVSLMDDPKYSLYKEIAEKAIKSIGDVLIGGVDILDSKKDGVVVLEINSFPDVFDIWFNTKQCAFKRFAEAFMNKIKRNICLKSS